MTIAEAEIIGGAIDTDDKLELLEFPEDFCLVLFAFFAEFVATFSLACSTSNRFFKGSLLTGISSDMPRLTPYLLLPSSSSSKCGWFPLEDSSLVLVAFLKLTAGERLDMFWNIPELLNITKYY